ncbi:Subtilisin-like serine protease, partial [Phytophthora palmivora]
MNTVAATSESTSLSFSCQLAAFGAYLPTEREDVNVLLAPDEKLLGCSSYVDESGQNPSRFEGAAVMVRRGECSFQKKLENMATTGAALMVLVNSEDALIPL